MYLSVDLLQHLFFFLSDEQFFSSRENEKKNYQSILINYLKLMNETEVDVSTKR